MRSWARFPLVAVLAAIFLVVGTTVASADPSGASGKNHGGRTSHAGADDTSGVTAGATTSSVTAGTFSQATTGVTSAVTTTMHSGATVTKDLACGILTPPFGSVVATDSIFILTPSGHATLVCKGDLPAGVGPDKAIVIEGLLCHAPGVTATNESHTTITPSGEVSLTCHFSG